MDPQQRDYGQAGKIGNLYGSDLADRRGSFCHKKKNYQKLAEAEALKLLKDD